MALNIRDREVHELARKVAAATGETMTQAVKVALEERLRRVGRPSEAERQRRVAAMEEFARKFREAEVIDPRTPEEIWGYDENGLPA
jgi:antitoxin VapB